MPLGLSLLAVMPWAITVQGPALALESSLAIAVGAGAGELEAALLRQALDTHLSDVDRFFVEPDGPPPSSPDEAVTWARGIGERTGARWVAWVTWHAGSESEREVEAAFVDTQGAATPQTVREPVVGGSSATPYRVLALRLRGLVRAALLVETRRVGASPEVETAPRVMAEPACSDRQLFGELESSLRWPTPDGLNGPAVGLHLGVALPRWRVGVALAAGWPTQAATAELSGKALPLWLGVGLERRLLSGLWGGRLAVWTGLEAGGLLLRVSARSKATAVRESSADAIPFFTLLVTGQVPLWAGWSVRVGPMV
ncbi:MAG: hypothetical protein AAB426_07230, partial [Myxococcota bacterium]